ncbi:MAG: hypothetical protein FJ255_00490 [Phycisphaerae bacterium]|nr:hypothetical protein [Phycisphaerae bacterium]
MTDPNHNPDSADGSDAVLDLVISRVVDGVAGPREWTAIERTAQSNPSIWREVALAQRHHADLTAAVARATARAEGVDLPASANYPMHARPAFGTVGTYLGWAAAAALAVLLYRGTPPQAGPASSSGPQAAGFFTADTGPVIASPAEALDLYVTRGQQTGRVIAELPEKILVQATPISDDEGDRLEVVYIRQIVERTTVPVLYRFAPDDTGQLLAPVPIRIEPQPATPTRGPM